MALYEIGTSTLHHGEALQVLQTLPTVSVDAVITDPPYSSGGLHKSDRTLSTAAKYVSTGQTKEWHGFSGDHRDQRSWVMWCQLWMHECYRVLHEGGYFLTFVDWRQLPSMTDALQCAGFIWRGIVPWNKGLGSRAPHKGYFRHQCEYIVWGTKGGCAIAEHAGPYPGCYDVTVRQSDKFHMTGKPTELMEQLSLIVPPGSLILDPFMGSGSTGIGAARAGRRFIGIEVEHSYFHVARERFEQLEAQGDLFEGVAA
ncbi:site-specific DNA-methyltransferase [Chitiniphilus purpureus]|uniref:Methyltransferase n=1 Tax=Chitiniphilus purpureus TaxID=2981137 RepID=A0ABY6DSJ0_9NEIS|nr:site-specific DNA-methyltransferase [Chitiniphilus sp. CD1]UXY16688.1 site-specific DNA-methyltransferase [Chitiniphilus sp. CD1]